MPVKSLITDPKTNQRAVVTQSGLHVVRHPAPPNNLGSTEETIIFRQFLTNDGTSTGSNDMTVDGTAAGNQDFWVPANTVFNRDRYIHSISFLLADGTMDLSLFGGIAALANGVRLFYTSPVFGELDISASIVRNVDFIRLGNGTPAFGDAAAAFIASSVSPAPTKDEAILPVISFTEAYGLPNGIRLPAGSDAKLVIRIQDDLQGITQFDCVAQGFEHILD